MSRFELDHSGFVARFDPPPGATRTAAFTALLPAGWTAVLLGAVGWGTTSLDAPVVCALATVRASTPATTPVARASPSS